MTDEARAVSKKLTFATHLPLGECAHFTHDGKPWIAVPAAKYARITTVTDRLLGSIAWARKELALGAPRIANVIAALGVASDEAIATKGPIEPAPELMTDDPLF